MEKRHEVTPGQNFSIDKTVGRFESRISRMGGEVYWESELLGSSKNVAGLLVELLAEDYLRSLGIITSSHSMIWGEYLRQAIRDRNLLSPEIYRDDSNDTQEGMRNEATRFENQGFSSTPDIVLAREDNGKIIVEGLVEVKAGGSAFTETHGAEADIEFWGRHRTLAGSQYDPKVIRDRFVKRRDQNSSRTQIERQMKALRKAVDKWNELDIDKTADQGLMADLGIDQNLAIDVTEPVKIYFVAPSDDRLPIPQNTIEIRIPISRDEIATIVERICRKYKVPITKPREDFVGLENMEVIAEESEKVMIPLLYKLLKLDRNKTDDIIGFLASGRKDVPTQPYFDYSSRPGPWSDTIWKTIKPLVIIWREKGSKGEFADWLEEHAKKGLKDKIAKDRGHEGHLRLVSHFGLSEAEKLLYLLFIEQVASFRSRMVNRRVNVEGRIQENLATILKRS